MTTENCWKPFSAKRGDGMRVWLYGRLSNDDDLMMHSLENQMQIARTYALDKGYVITGESYDDNVSGMRFDRRGLNQLTAAVESGQVDAVIVKDLSRLGRHKLQTGLFIDYLRQYNVAVISVTEGLNTLSDGDDLIIGVRSIMNDFYAKDIGNKIRHGYRQKQQKGLVITPPFGYWKDKNTGRILLHPEASVTVRMIYEHFGSGMMLKVIARKLNKLGRKTPKQLRDERNGKAEGKTYLWTYQSVHNILSDISYTGVLINHKTETKGRQYTYVPEDGWFRHDGFFPVIIEHEVWEQVQTRLKGSVRPYSGNKRTHRYAGLLTCGDCGSTFIPKIRRWNGSQYVAYVCNGYMHHGKDYCCSHSIREETLDAQVRKKAEKLRNQLLAEQTSLAILRKQYEIKSPAINAQVKALMAEVDRLEQEVDEIFMEKIKMYNT